MDKALFRRVKAFDPTAVIARAFGRGALRATVRFMPPGSMYDFFAPPTRYTCACGCGRTVQTYLGTYAREACEAFCEQVSAILRGDTAVIRRYLQHGRSRCAYCWDPDSFLEIDHIVPVRAGGAGRWLSNYQLLCHRCHEEKTRADERRYPPPTPSHERTPTDDPRG